jgi:uncharacterized membrane protein
MSNSRQVPADVAEIKEKPAGGTIRPARRKRSGNIIVIIFAIFVLAVLAAQWPPFITFNPQAGRLSSATHPWFFPVLMIHIVASTVALIACVFQPWQWLRTTRPRVHRIVGRIYVFAGVFPAAVAALLLAIVWFNNPITSVSDTLSSTLWLVITAYAFRLGRQRRFADHRRWMLRSLALTASIIVNTSAGVFLGMFLTPLLASKFAGSTAVLNEVWSGLDVWVGWTISILAVEWWLERDLLRRSARRRVPADRAEPVAASPQL